MLKWSRRTSRQVCRCLALTALGYALAIPVAEAQAESLAPDAVSPVPVDPRILDDNAKLVVSGAAKRDYLGRAVALWGENPARPETLVAGAVGKGSAFVFVVPADGVGRNFVQTAELRASKATPFPGEFGVSVSLSGDTIVVGAPGANCEGGGRSSSCGSAYVFVKPTKGWGSVPNQTETVKLTASDAAERDRFGASVSIFGDTVVVGAPNAKCGSVSRCGSAYVFAKPSGGWGSAAPKQTETARLSGDRMVSAGFGISVAASGDAGGTHETVIVGAPRDTRCADSSKPCGSAYVFVEPPEGWAGHPAYSARLRASDVDVGDEFGCSVAAYGDLAVAGARHDDCTDGDRDCGSAYVFEKPAGGWTGNVAQKAKLTASDGGQGRGQGPLLGSSVSIFGSAVVAGAPYSDCDSGDACGSAYVFTEPAGGWPGALSETLKLRTGDASSGDNLGVSVAVVGATAVAGATGDSCESPGCAGAGAVHVFRTLPDDRASFWQASLFCPEATYSWHPDGPEIVVGMAAGEQCLALITVQNTGTSTWTADPEPPQGCPPLNSYRLGAMGDSTHPFQWLRRDQNLCAARVLLGGDVPPGAAGTFSFYLKLEEDTPVGALLPVKVKMLQERVRWFGEELVWYVAVLPQG